METNASDEKKLLIIPLPEMTEMAKRILSELERMGDHRFRIVDLDCTSYADGSLEVELKDSVRFRYAYLLASPALDIRTGKPNPNESLMRLLLAINALQNSSVKKDVMLVLPYIPYQRADRTGGKRKATGISVVKKLLKSHSCVDRIITCEPHFSQLGTVFDGELDELSSVKMFGEMICERWGEHRDNLVVVSPDAGGLSRATRLADYLSRKLGTLIEVMFLNKVRKEANKVEKSFIPLSGNYHGKKAVLIDDIGDTMGTACQGMKTLTEAGMDVLGMFVTHGVFSSHEGVSAADRCRAAGLRVVTTNTIPRSDEYYTANADWIIHVVDIAPRLAKAIHNMATSASFSALNGHEEK